MRALFISLNICGMPWFSFDSPPTGQPMHLPASPKFRTHVAEPLMPILCSMLATLTSFGRRASPSWFGRELRDDEEREPLGPGRRAVDAREHEVDDVLGEVVVAAGDEDLRPADRVAAVARCATPSVFALPTSLPACGSVRHIVPAHVPSNIRGQ